MERGDVGDLILTTWIIAGVVLLLVEMVCPAWCELIFRGNRNQEPCAVRATGYGCEMSGRHFLQIPGPTNLPDRVLRAIARPVIDHRGLEFARLARGIVERLAEVSVPDSLGFHDGCTQSNIATTRSR